MNASRAPRALGLAIAVLLGAPAPAQQDDASRARCRALAAAQDAGALTVAAALAALGGTDEAVARTAAAIVRHEWLELPAELFAGLDADAGAARVLLHELAVAPRPAATAWARTRARAAPGRTADDRCLALAAGAPLVAADVDLLLRTLLDGDAGDGWRAAVAVLPSKLADAGVGRLHAGLATGALDVERAGPWLDRLGDGGVRALLGLVVSLPYPVALPLCQRVHERAPELVRERVAAALDGAGAIERVWLAFAGDCLDADRRVARIDAVLTAPDAPTADRELAAAALLDARRMTPALVAFFERLGGGALVARALDGAIERLPEATLRAWLASDLQQPVARALARRSTLSPELERAARELLLEVGVAEGALGQPLASALVARGSAATLQAVWPLLRDSANWPLYVDDLSRRREPFVHELLLSELQAEAPATAPELRRAQLDAVGLALVALGDRRELQRLLAAAPTAEPGVVRRCALHVRPLPATAALQLLDAVPAVANVDTAAAMLAWAATAIADEAVHARLLAMWRGPAATLEAAELREVALRALADSDHRPALLAELRRALAAGPLPDELEPLPYALLGSMPQPPGADDLALCAELVLLPPRHAPAREAEAAERGPDGTFPLVAAVAEALRRAPAEAAGAAFAGAATAALADPRHAALSPQRFVVLWRELAIAPAVQRAIGGATAELALAAAAAATDRGGVDPDADGDAARDVPVGPLHHFALLAATARGDLDAARAHALAAGRALLRLPEHRRAGRIFLGERDPGAGADPWAALAALPHELDRRLALARGDAGAAAGAAARVREFAGHDRGTLVTLPPSPPETVR